MLAKTSLNIKFYSIRYMLTAYYTGLNHEMFLHRDVSQ